MCIVNDIQCKPCAQLSAAADAEKHCQLTSALGHDFICHFVLFKFVFVPIVAIIVIVVCCMSHTAYNDRLMNF